MTPKLTEEQKKELAESIAWVYEEFDSAMEIAYDHACNKMMHWGIELTDDEFLTWDVKIENLEVRND